MSAKGENILRTYAPGIWVDTDHDFHFDAVKFLEGHGVAVTPENIERAEEEIRQTVREFRPDIPIVDDY